MQSSLPERLHVGVIMDGNGRWATRRGLPRPAGHREGAKAVHRLVEAAPILGVGALSLFVFSSDNWRRPAPEVAAMMRLVRGYLERETGRLAESGVRLSVIGRRDRLPAGMAEAIARTEAATARGARLHLRIAFDFSGRDAILRAAAAARGPQDLTREGFSKLVSGEAGLRDVDLVIRTSGEQRLSDFLIWECAYAELYFTERLWPDFTGADLAAAIDWFRARNRRFGGLGAAQAAG